MDYAHVLQELSDTHFPKASKIVLVQDNLNTHKPASLYEAFPAAEARRLVERFEWHYTPKHGSWLDMAESELSVLSSQCLDRRIPDKLTLIEEVAAWEDSRNKKHVKADWQFTIADARVKLKRLYPAMWTTRGTRCSGSTGGKAQPGSGPLRPTYCSTASDRDPNVSTSVRDLLTNAVTTLSPTATSISGTKREAADPGLGCGTRYP